MEFSYLSQLVNQLNVEDHSESTTTNTNVNEMNENVVVCNVIFLDNAYRILFPLNATIGDIYHYISQKYFDGDFSDILYIIRENDLSILGIAPHLTFETKLDGVIHNEDVLRVSMIDVLRRVYENVKPIIPELFAEWLFSDSERFDHKTSICEVIRELNQPSRESRIIMRAFLEEMANILNEHFAHDEEGPTHLTDEQFDKLPSYTYQQLIMYKSQHPDHKIPDHNECPICCEEFAPDNQLVVLPCKHYYHTECARKWLTKEKNTCPMCVQKVDSDEEHETESESG
jgi:hypothetical protein